MMVKSIEITTFTTGFARPGQIIVLADLQVQPVVNFSYLFQEPDIYSASRHHFVFLLIFPISSKLYSLPRLMPGHF
jgi:hypothetical protein